MAVHTVPSANGDGWVNKLDSVIVSTHTTKDDAVKQGRLVAIANKTEHVVHNLDGTIAYSNSYGGDPNPPKDKK